MIDEAIHSLADFDRQSARLEWAARLRGDSTAELRELIRSREEERQRICEEYFGPSAD